MTFWTLYRHYRFLGMPFYEAAYYAFKQRAR